MSIRSFSRLLGLSYCAAAALAAGPSAASETGEPVVVEMFLSQACSQSPPAAKFQAELSRRPDLVALTWHIDYWNVLSNRKHGRWQDPFADPSFSARQRIYNRRIRGRGTVFTPQAIVNGVASEVGSKREDIERFIELEKRELRTMQTTIRRAGDSIEVKVNPSGNDFRDVVLVKFKTWSSTPIGRGDNAGMVFDEPHVVVSAARLGVISHKAETFAFPAPAEGQGCAVLVQEAGQGRILGARYCP